MITILNKANALLSGRSSFFRNITLLAGGTAGAQLLTVLAAPLITRIYSPSDFGVFALFSSYLSWLLIIASLRYELAIPIAKSDEEAYALLGTSLVVVIFISVLLLVIGTGITFAAPNLTFGIGRTFLLCALPPALLIGGTYQIANFWAVRQKNYSNIARTKFFQSIAQVGTQISLPMVASGPVGLIVGGIVGKSAGFTKLLSGTNSISITTLLNPKTVWNCAKQFSEFPLCSAPAAIIHASLFQVPVFFLAAIYGPAAAGLFALQERILGLPSSLIGQAVSQAFYGEASTILAEDPKRLPALLKRSVTTMFLLGLGPAIIFALFGPDLFTLVFGEPWREAGAYARILSGAMLLRFCVGPVFYILTIMRKQRMQLIADSIGLLFLGIGIAAAHFYSLPPRQAVAFYGIAVVVTYSLLFYFSLRSVKQLTGRE